MDSPQLKPMRKRFAYAVAIVFTGLIVIPLNGLILPSTAVAQQQRINSNTSPSQSTNSSSLRTIFKQLENSVVQITSKPSLIEIIGAVAGIVTVFGLFGNAMYWLGVTRTKVNPLTADVKEVKKDVNNLTIKFSADLLARNLLDKYIEARKEENKK